MNYVQIYFRKKRLLFEAITDIRVLFSALILSFVIIFAFLTFAFYRKGTIEKVPQLKPYPLELIEASALNKTQIICGCTITDFLEFSIQKNQFKFQGDLWFTYDPTMIDPSVFKQFYIVGGFISELEGPFITTEDAHHNILIYRITGSFICPLEYKNFPFDAHRLSIDFEIPGIDTKKMVLVGIPESIKCIPNIQIPVPGWNYNGFTEAITGTAQVFQGCSAEKIEHAHVVFSAVVSRASFKKIFLIFIPLFLIFFISLFSLTFDVVKSVSTVLSLTVGGVTALFFYQTSMDRISPVTETFTLADRAYTVILLLTIITLTLQIYLLHFYMRKERMTSLPEILQHTAMTINIIRSGFFLLFLIATVCAIGLLII